MKKKPTKRAKRPTVVTELRDMRAELNERLRVIESDIGKIQKNIGILATRKP
jgi:hypothetical protein